MVDKRGNERVALGQRLNERVALGQRLNERVALGERSNERVMKTDENEIKTNLTNELATVLRNATSEYPSGDALSNESTQTLCNAIEAVFIHGLKKAFFSKKPRSSKYPEPNFWPFVSKYTHKAVLDEIASANQIKTEVGKSRAWVRILLNENAMENYLSLLTRNTASLSKFYEKWAFLRDAERMNVLAGYAKGLTGLIVEAPINSAFLNNWTPTPLILSGLMAGKPARLEQLVKSRRRGGSLNMLEDAELAENALESLYDPTEMSTSGAGGSDAGLEDDQTSVYSHPSMLDGGNGYFPVLNATCSTILSNPVPEDNALNCDPHQIRVTRRTHRRIRFSSKSSGESSGSSRNGSVSAIVNESQVAETVGEEVRNIENACDNIQLISSSIQKVGNGSNGNHEYPTETCEEKTVSMKEDKSVESDNELSTIRDSKSSQNDSKNSVKSFITADGGPFDDKLKLSVQEMSYNPYNLCPAITFENGEQSSDALEGKTEIQTLRRSPDMELERSISLQDELYLAEHSGMGNSLLGKGWVYHHQKAEPLVDHDSTISSSTNTDCSRNFDMEIRNILDGSLDEIVNDKHSDDEYSKDQITIHEETEHLSQRCDSDKTSSFTSNHQEASFSKKPDTKIQSIDDDSELSDKALIDILTTIPREKGLDSQDFRCPACRKSIGPTFASYRKCGFDENYYCDGCWNRSDESVIPSRLIRNWDTHPRHVCRKNMAFIESIRDKAVLRIDQINPQLYEHSHALNSVKFLREKLSLSVMYLLSCRKSVAEDLERRVWPKDYLYKDIHLYSFTDLLTVISGHMGRYLNDLFNFTTEHIRRCVLCVQKGFICEICSSAQAIYPFQLEITSRCLECFSVYHKNCIGQQRCPKCIRRERYSQQQPSINSEHLLLDLD